MPLEQTISQNMGGESVTANPGFFYKLSTYFLVLYTTVLKPVSSALAIVGAANWAPLAIHQVQQPDTYKVTNDLIDLIVQDDKRVRMLQIAVYFAASVAALILLLEIGFLMTRKFLPMLKCPACQCPVGIRVE
jgi:hypothetical protein